MELCHLLSQPSGHGPISIIWCLDPKQPLSAVPMRVSWIIQFSSVAIHQLLCKTVEASERPWRREIMAICAIIRCAQDVKSRCSSQECDWSRVYLCPSPQLQVSFNMMIRLWGKILLHWEGKDDGSVCMFSNAVASSHAQGG